MTEQENPYATIAAEIRAALDQLDHVLPGQAPIQDFVHHNTLHGFQHLPFPQALEAAEKETGFYGYYPESHFRQLFREKRIIRDDLKSVLEADETLAVNKVIARNRNVEVTRLEVLLAGLIHDISPVSNCQLEWYIYEQGALDSFVPDITADSKTILSFSGSGKKDSVIVRELWQACLDKFDMDYRILHPEDMVDLSPSQADAMIANMKTGDEEEDPGEARVTRTMRRESEVLIKSLIRRVGDDLTMRGLLVALTGEDILENIQPALIRSLENFMDQGLAAWRGAGKDEGFYQAWCREMSSDLIVYLDDLPEWREVFDNLPDDSMAAVIAQLRYFGVPQDKWFDYLKALALELPGWSGMFFWRSRNPGYKGNEARFDMIDYFAARLVLERLYAQQLCRTTFNLAPNLDLLQWYCRNNRDEFFVRYAMSSLRLPEYIASSARRLTNLASTASPTPDDWRTLSHMIWTWRHSPAADRPRGHTVYRSAWRLFLLSQYLGISAEVISQTDKRAFEEMLLCLDELTPNRAGFIWLQAYEKHYRDELFNAVIQNHGRGRWKTRSKRPSAQVVFCMDDREEGIRRHLEALNPEIETLGAAGFFGVAINWKGLNDTETTALCPIVVTPSHKIEEHVQPEQDKIHEQHRKGRKRRMWLNGLLYNNTRKGLFTATLVIMVSGIVGMFAVAGKTIMPRITAVFTGALRRLNEPPVKTVIGLTASDDTVAATPEHNRTGFTDNEQAERVYNFLNTIGLRSGFAPVTVLMGHGSSSQNNPHLAAYDCGACSGRHGGPNARVFAAMANRPEVRELVKLRGISIPVDTRFVGANHNTCDEVIDWFDTDQLPETFMPAFTQLQNELATACRQSAQERCRKFASAPNQPGEERALAHVVARSFDFSQARPELGHATNAAAFIGRRSLSQGAFFDRRVFLISYDCTGDPEGRVLEAILLAAGPVGAGINLEYYFSSVNNEQYGCGTKVLHNLVGFYGVMEGAESDLRTGLPKQMIEVHEAMRLQVLVEAKTDVLTSIYQNQPPLQELIGNGWLLLSAKDPDSDRIDVFHPEHGWEKWEGKQEALQTVNNSKDWYRGTMEPLPPVLLEQKEHRHG